MIRNIMITYIKRIAYILKLSDIQKPMKLFFNEGGL